MRLIVCHPYIAIRSHSPLISLFSGSTCGIAMELRSGCGKNFLAGRLPVSHADIHLSSLSTCLLLCSQAPEWVGRDPPRRSAVAAAQPPPAAAAGAPPAAGLPPAAAAGPLPPTAGLPPPRATAPAVGGPLPSAAPQQQPAAGQAQDVPGQAHPPAGRRARYAQVCRVVHLCTCSYFIGRRG
jgi:hypothetical protein